MEVNEGNSSNKNFTAKSKYQKVVLSKLAPLMLEAK
jgi:hypothetical protein